MPQRAYIFHQDANEGKVDQLRAFARRWRQSAEYVKEIQWRLFFETGSFDKHTPVSRYRDDIKDRIGGSAKIQAVSHQVVSVLKSWVSNRKQDFTRIVERSSLSEEIRHQLHVINLTESWFDPEPIEMEETGDVIDDRVRKLARIIFKRCMDEHRRPNLSNIHPILDQRMVSIETSHSASRYRKWLKVSTHISSARPSIFP